jgi:Rho family protein
VGRRFPDSSSLFLALKCDLREDPTVKEKLSRRSQHPVTYDEGLSVARRLKATRYLECSAKHNRGVQEAIMEAAKVAVGTRAKGGGGSGAIGERLKQDRLDGCKCVIM